MRSTHRSRARAHNHAANHKNCCDREVTINRIHIPWYFRSRGFLIGHTAPGFPSAPVSFPVLAKLQRRRRRRRRRRPCVSAPASPSTWPPSATSVHSVPLPARHSATLHQARPPSLLLQPQQDNHRHLAPPPQATIQAQRFNVSRERAAIRYAIQYDYKHRIEDDWLHIPCSCSILAGSGRHRLRLCTPNEQQLLPVDTAAYSSCHPGTSSTATAASTTANGFFASESCDRRGHRNLVHRRKGAR